MKDELIDCFLRKRKLKEAQLKDRERERAEIQYQATREHYRRLRQFKLQQMQTIQLLPACKRKNFSREEIHVIRFS